MSSTAPNAAGIDSAFSAIEETGIPGCVEIKTHVRGDARGRFVKTFHAEWFKAHGLRTDFVEQYYSVSSKGVLRGLHFQKPPAHHAKLVYCVEGAVLDAAVDLRPGSPAFGRHALREISAERANLLYIPEGLAHGFYVLSESATLIYAVTSVYDAACDAGIHWNSAGIAWPDRNPTVSQRDRQFASFEESAGIFRGM
ncbi:MAG TPA: dTDP-4-dehydrorhamnose 3,5-epimerase [Terracidiphilus sp.]|jgi:dTDP-4-dehydrorhamnose 3,5-epimerase|nr:dTDP-4-dehydrorhamnose 3,5-epimerase [Terracidiphilus sp.]